jgi:Tfp pilus assembly protein PilX
MTLLRKPSTQNGYVLITVIMFMVLLTLVALAALKNSGLEARMGGNANLHAQSFESSETARSLADSISLIDANVFYRGWPNSTAIGGTIPVADYDAGVVGMIAASKACPLNPTSSNGFTLCLNPATKAPRNWYDHNSECGEATPLSPCPVFVQNNLDQDATYTQSFNPSTSSSAPSLYQTGIVSVYKMTTTLATGAGSAQSSGYLGLGRSAAAGGGLLYFHINARGHDTGSSATSTPQAGVDTSAIYRDVIRN